MICLSNSIFINLLQNQVTHYCNNRLVGVKQIHKVVIKVSSKQNSQVQNLSRKNGAKINDVVLEMRSFE